MVYRVVYEIHYVISKFFQYIQDSPKYLFAKGRIPVIFFSDEELPPFFLTLRFSNSLKKIYTYKALQLQSVLWYKIENELYRRI